MKATGQSTWSGSWKRGAGTISTLSDTLKEAPFSFASRFEGAAGANPEELLGAAHAGCFNQALANNFGMIELEAVRITTSVTIEFSDSLAGHPAIQSLHIDVDAQVPGITEDQFMFCAERARTNCTISKILTCPITISARLTR